MLQARGFASEEEASDFGSQLCAITELAGICTRLGIDVGVGQPTGGMSEEFARRIGLLRPHERLHPNVHGLAILPDDDCTRIAIVEAEATGRADPNQLESALTELAAGPRVQPSAAAQGVRMLNLALINPQPLAQVVLALSAVEVLGQKERWTDAQESLLAQLGARVEADSSGDNAERREVADAIRGLNRVGLSQGVMQVLARLGLPCLQEEWKRIYRLRSSLFHGRTQLAEHEIAKLANDARPLCGKIILRLAEDDGATLPSISRVNFPKA